MERNAKTIDWGFAQSDHHGDIKIKISYLYDKNKLEIVIDNNGISLDNIFKLNSDTLFSLSIINELSGQLNSSFYIIHNDNTNISKLIPN